jgi:uncharacterized protein YkwD
MFRICVTAAWVAITFSYPALSAGPPAINDRALQSEILTAHNTERRSLGVADLKWSADLAEDAADWAKGLAKSGALKHASQRSHGENLWMGAAGRSTPAGMVGLWLAEKKNYIPGSAHPKTSKTGNWADVGHYTAIVWSATAEVGCAVSRNATHDFLVCRYNPAGNVRGYAAYDVNAARRVAEAKPAAKPDPAPKPSPAPAAGKKAPPAAPVPLPIPKPATVGAG